MNLITITDFVSTYLETGCAKTQFNKLHRYNDFLKQPIELWMFIPCDEKNNPLKRPNIESNTSDSNIAYICDMETYRKAVDRKLFKGFKLSANNEVNKGDLYICLDTLQFYVEGPLGIGGGDICKNDLYSLSKALPLELELTEKTKRELL